MPARPARSRLLALGAAGALALAPAVALPSALVPAAHAHSTLLTTDPADGATVPASPERVSLTFNENVKAQFATLTVVDGGRRNLVVGDPVVDGPTVSARVGQLGPGAYTIGYRVTSADGHVVQGSSAFTVADGASGTAGGGSGTASPGAASPAPSSASATDAPGAPTGSDSGGGEIALVAVPAVLAVVLIGGAWWLLRRRTS